MGAGPGCAAHLKPVAPPARSSVSPSDSAIAYTSSAVSAGLGGADVRGRAALGATEMPGTPIPWCATPYG